MEIFMGKKKKNSASRKIDDIDPKIEAKKKKLPVYTHSAYISSVASIIAGLAVQFTLAVLVIGRLPSKIPTSWIGIGTPTQTMPSWIVFIAFPVSQFILLVVAGYSPKDANERKVMEWGKAISLILLTVLFTALQGSAFRL
jgi:heme A synthase